MYSEMTADCLLRPFQTSIVNCVEPADVVDHLYQNDVIDDDEMERVLLPTYTRRTRCRSLLHILRRRLAVKPSTFDHFVKALEGSYEFLSDEIRTQISNYSPDINIYPDTRQQILQSDVPCRECCVNKHDLIDTQVTLTQDQDLYIPDLNDEGCETVIEKDVATVHRYAPKRANIELKSDIAFNDRTCSSNLSEVTRVDLIVEQQPCIEEQSEDENSEIYRQLVRRHRHFSESECYSPRILPPSNFGKNSRHATYQLLFDGMSELVNSGKFSQFDQQMRSISSLMINDVNIACIVLYLDACRGLIQMKFKHCKRALACALELVPKTLAPGRFTVELLSVRCWMYLKRSHKMNKLEESLKEALHTIEQDPITCSGKAAGWIYVDVAKSLLPLMRSCRSGARNNKDKAETLRQRAMTSLVLAMEHFQREKSQDGPYGFNYAAVKLSSLILATDDYLNLIDQIEPTSEEICKAEALLKQVDNSAGGLEQILRPLYLIADSDLKFRCGNILRASEVAKEARGLVIKTGLVEELVYAQIRCERYGHLADASKLSRVRSIPVYELLRQKSCDDSKCESDAELNANNSCRKKIKQKRKRSSSLNKSPIPVATFQHPVKIVCLIAIAALLWYFLTKFWLQWVIIV